MARAVSLSGSRDLIVAPATAAGVGAVAIIRLSGPGAAEVASKIFSHAIHEQQAGFMRLGTLRTPAGEHIDRCLAVRWIAPHSYTGEDVVEFHVHGSPAIVDAALRACLDVGARLADPGEFTRRAFHARKMDLAQAEAVAALTNSRTEDSRRAALRQLEGGLSERLSAIRAKLIQVTAELEASVDYPEENLPEADLTRLAALADESSGALSHLLSGFDRGRLLAEGANVVLAGPPNAGKSSLFNGILGRERAIVTPHPGTTRDSLEAMISIGGIPVTLVDTAGLRQASEEIESLGIDRARRLMAGADLVLFLVDPTAPLESAAREYEALSGVPHLLVLTRRDVYTDANQPQTVADEFELPSRLDWLAISNHSFDDIKRLEEAILRVLRARPEDGGDDCLITSRRHAKAVQGALSALSDVPRAIRDGLSPELIVLDLATALSELDSITGADTLDEDVLDAIFSTFCLGK